MQAFPPSNFFYVVGSTNCIFLKIQNLTTENSMSHETDIVGWEVVVYIFQFMQNLYKIKKNKPNTQKFTASAHPLIPTHQEKSKHCLP